MFKRNKIVFLKTAIKCVLKVCYMTIIPLNDNRFIYCRSTYSILCYDKENLLN